MDRVYEPIDSFTARRGPDDGEVSVCCVVEREHCSASYLNRCVGKIGPFWVLIRARTLAYAGFMPTAAPLVVVTNTNH